MSKHTTIDQLKLLAQRTKTEIDAVDSKVTSLTTRVEDLVTAGGEPNVITAIKVNGTPQAITDKAVDIAVPGYTIEKAADSGDYASIYQLMKDGVATGAAINIPKDMVVQSGSVVTLDADGATAVGLTNAGTYIKLVLANATNDTLYIDVSGLIEYVTSGSVAGDMVVINIDETTHKVTATITDGTITKVKLAAEVQDVLDDVANKVDKVEGKGLSSNDYTDEEKAKLAAIETATDAEVTAMLTEVFGAAS